MGTEYKPVHIITNQREFHHILYQYHIEVEIRSNEDNDGTRPHWHIIALWPTRKDYYGRTTLNPARTTVLKRWRRLYGCTWCKYWKGQTLCPRCNLDIKFKWLKGEKHHQNLYKYIERKLQGRESAEGTSSEEEEDTGPRQVHV